MCEWIRRVPASIESMTGLRDPAAKGAIVSGMSAADMRLQDVVSTLIARTGRSPGGAPLKGPVVAAVHRARVRRDKGIIDRALDDLRKRRQDSSDRRRVKLTEGQGGGRPCCEEAREDSEAGHVVDAELILADKHSRREGPSRGGGRKQIRQV